MKNFGLAMCLLFLIGSSFAGVCRAQIIGKVNRNVVDAETSTKFIAKFVEKLDARLKGKSVGYTFYATYRNGLSQGRAGGDARRAPDSNPRKMTIDDKFNIASVSKMITAAAVLKLLNDKGVSLDTAVSAYLPPKWKLGSNWKSITFRELLTHRAGVRCPGDVTYAELRKCVATGINTADKATYKYNNSNFALFRFIIPRLNGFDGGNTAENVIGENIASGTYSTLYMDYVRKNVFEPAGLKGIDCRPITTNPALSYQFPGPIGPGTDWGITSETCGSQGWNMNVKQLTAFMGALSATEKIVPSSVYKNMKDGMLGFFFKDATSVPGITSYGHTGYYCCELNSLLVNYSNGLNVALIINSQFGPKQDFFAQVNAALNEALK